MSEVLKIADATARNESEKILRGAMSHEGHKVIAERIGISSSNISKYLSGDQATSLERFCAMIDAAGLKLVGADEITVNPHEYKTTLLIASRHYERMADAL